MSRLSDRGFTATRGKSYTFEGTANDFDNALPITHNLGSVPNSLELWVEQTAGQWEKQDPATYVLGTSTTLITAGTTLASVVGGATNVRLIASSGAVAVSVQEASATQAGIVGIGAQTLAGPKTLNDDLTVGSNALFVDVSSGFTGVGTVTPGELLTANGTIKSIGGTISDSGTAGVTLRYDTGAATAKIETWTSKPFDIQTGGTSRLYISASGNVGIGTASPSWKLDVSSGLYTLLVGADDGLTTRTDSTQKTTRIGLAHYTNTEEPVGLIFGYSNASANFLAIGGGSGAVNAATSINFYTGSTTTTTTGTLVGNISSAGAWTLGPNTSSNLNLIVNGRASITHGLTFPSSANVSTDANTLDDYEEGTWTPAYAATTGSFTTLTYSAQIGTYTKIGRLVICHGQLSTSNVSVGTASGNLLITGLPFVNQTIAGMGFSTFCRRFTGTSVVTPGLQGSTGTTSIVIAQNTASSIVDPYFFQVSNLTTGAATYRNEINFSIIYLTTV